MSSNDGALSGCNIALAVLHSASLFAVVRRHSSGDWFYYRLPPELVDDVPVGRISHTFVTPKYLTDVIRTMQDPSSRMRFTERANCKLGLAS